MSTKAISSPPANTLLTVARGLQVLRAFKSERSPLSNAELVRRTGLPKATVSRLTSTLLQLGFLSHVAGGRHFELAPAPLAMGHAYLEGNDMLRAARPVLQDMADHLDASVAVAVPNGLDMLYVGYCAGAGVATLRLGVGSLLPMGLTATGRAYLWGVPADEQKALMLRLKRQAGERAAVVERSIHEAFAELDRTGVCCVSNGHLRDTFGIALPITLGRQRVPMALCCGKAAVRPDLALERERGRMVPALKAAAVKLQDLLSDVDGQP